MNIHLTRKDFIIDWYSGSGAGGQHRNKHQNCCRITHIESGLTSCGTSSRSRVTNQREAFTALASKVVDWYKTDESHAVNSGIVRNYNEQRDEVMDKKTGRRFSYRGVLLGNHFGRILEAGS